MLSNILHQIQMGSLWPTTYTLGDLAKILDESPVESCMALEGTNFLHSTWGWKVRDQIYLCFVNLNTPMRYDMPQYNPLLSHKMAFLPVKHKVLLLHLTKTKVRRCRHS